MLPYALALCVTLSNNKVSISFDNSNLLLVLVVTLSFVLSLVLFGIRTYLFNQVYFEEIDELDDEYKEDEEVISEDSEEITEESPTQTNKEVEEQEVIINPEDEVQSIIDETEVPQDVFQDTLPEETANQTEEVIEENNVNLDDLPDDEDDEEVETEIVEEDDDEDYEDEIDLSEIDSIDITNENGTRERSVLTPSIVVLDENGNPKKINRKFMSRLMFASVEAKEYYSAAKNYLMMYRAKSRLSSRCETFRYKGIMAKIVLAGKSVKVYLAISPKDLEGTKYHFKDVSNKSVYQEVPVLVKIASKRGLNHFKELVDFMMAARLVKPKKNFVPVDYLPQLIPNGEAILSSLGLGTDYIYDYINVKSIPTDIPDNLDEIIPVIAGTELLEEPVEVSIFLDTLCTYFEDDEVITLEVLKEKRILRYGDTLKVKARGTLDRRFTIYADSFESQALKMLMCTNCKAIKIVR